MVEKKYFSSKSQKNIFLAHWKYNKYYVYPMRKSSSQQSFLINQNKTWAEFFSDLHSFFTRVCLQAVSAALENLDFPKMSIRVCLWGAVTSRVLIRFGCFDPRLKANEPIRWFPGSFDRAQSGIIELEVQTWRRISSKSTKIHFHHPTIHLTLYN